MLLEEIINPDAVLCNAHARSKKHCLEILSELLVRSQPDIAADDIFARLIERERLGCTSLEAGVAFPHCRIEGIDRCIAAMIKLSDPIDFDASDGEPVDLVFGLMVPTEVTDSHHADIAMSSAHSALVINLTTVAAPRPPISSRPLTVPEAASVATRYRG